MEVWSNSIPEQAEVGDGGFGVFFGIGYRCVVAEDADASLVSSPPVFQSSRMSLAHRLRQGDPRAFGATNRGPPKRMTRQNPHRRGTRPREWSAAAVTA